MVLKDHVRDTWAPQSHADEGLQRLRHNALQAGEKVLNILTSFCYQRQGAPRRVI